MSEKSEERHPSVLMGEAIDELVERIHVVASSALRRQVNLIRDDIRNLDNAEIRVQGSNVGGLSILPKPKEAAELPDLDDDGGESVPTAA